MMEGGKEMKVGSKGEEARRKIEEIKKRLKEIEEKTGKKIGLNKILNALLTKENLGKGANRILLILDNMLKEGTEDYIEVGSCEKEPVKVEMNIQKNDIVEIISPSS